MLAVVAVLAYTAKEHQVLALLEVRVAGVDPVAASAHRATQVKGLEVETTVGAEQEQLLAHHHLEEAEQYVLFGGQDGVFLITQIRTHNFLCFLQ
jgi:hypothetical protein